ncbi:hypothetical protein PR001_g11609 [Phytophthora rubi]|uniref:Secreted protein n=1 Tax=Phytophthora rubi TaxID=129364 RepID=A0A6A3MBU8_9STRA|nr:hypothetical protein PR001_g11609 [Phytophthora rubi]
MKSVVSHLWGLSFMYVTGVPSGVSASFLSKSSLIVYGTCDCVSMLYDTCLKYRISHVEEHLPCHRFRVIVHSTSKTM